MKQREDIRERLERMDRDKASPLAELIHAQLQDRGKHFLKTLSEASLEDADNTVEVELARVARDLSKRTPPNRNPQTTAMFALFE